MKRLTVIFLCLISIIGTAAQTSGDRLRDQAAAALENKEYTTARYYYKRAYEAYSDAGQIEPAVQCAVNVSSLYHRENYYKEAFEILSHADALVTAEEQKNEKTTPAARAPAHLHQAQKF